MGKSKKKNSAKKNILQKYNEKETKGNVKNTLLKGAVDTVAGSVIGTGIGAVVGNKAPFAGIALILAGHYLGDKSGVLRLTGASTMAYGIGKAQAYKSNPEMKSVSNRLGGLKQDLLGALFSKFQKEEKETHEKNRPTESKEEINNDPIRFEVENEPSDESELTDLKEYQKFNNQEGVKSIKVDKNEDDDDLDGLFDDEYSDIDLTLI